MESLESKLAVLQHSVDALERTIAAGNTVTKETTESIRALEIAGAGAAAEAKTYGPRLTVIEDWKAEQTGFQRAIFWVAGMFGALIGSIVAAIVTAWVKGKS